LWPNAASGILVQRFERRILGEQTQVRSTAVTLHLDELETCVVCRVVKNGGSQLVLEIRDSFWLYLKQQTPGSASEPETEFVQKVRGLFLTPACVQASFSDADEKLALGLYRRGFSMEQIKRAIM
jgi:hypothetical protein